MSIFGGDYGSSAYRMRHIDRHFYSQSLVTNSDVPAYLEAEKLGHEAKKLRCLKDVTT